MCAKFRNISKTDTVAAVPCEAAFLATSFENTRAVRTVIQAFTNSRRLICFLNGPPHLELEKVIFFTFF
jgi:hypothetical protein